MKQQARGAPFGKAPFPIGWAPFLYPAAECAAAVEGEDIV